MVDWSYYDKFDSINEAYLPSYGQGDTMATQIVTAVNKLVYKWYNDGDVYDNTEYLRGWVNDLSSYANWLYWNVGCLELLKIVDAKDGSDYEDILKEVADKMLDADFLDGMRSKPKVGDVYDCTGPFEFSYRDDDDDEYLEE